MNFKWVDDYLEKEVNKHQKLSGYYNHNYIVEHEGTKYIIRIPIPNAEIMDYRIIPEEEVLLFLEKVDFKAPRLLYQDNHKRYSVHSFIEGTTLNELYYDRARIPNWIPVDLAKQMKQMHQLNIESFQKYATNLGVSPDTKEFYLSIFEHVRELYQEMVQRGYRGLYNQLCFPDDPFESIEEDINKLIPRPYAFSHCDVHRKNIICNEALQSLVIIDWELVLISDPAYDLSVHFYKMRYEPDQEELFLNEYINNSEHFKDLYQLKEQIWIYRKLEQIKSASIDCIRAVNDIKNENLTYHKELDYAVRYFNKLKKAWKVWNVEKGKIKEPEQILGIFKNYT